MGNIRNDLAQMVGHARWRDIHQSINRLAAQTIAGNGNEERNANGGQRIALLKAKLRGNEAQEHENGAHHIGGEMQRISGQRIAIGLFGNFSQREPAHQIN